ncbi:AAA family ATPase [Synechococcus sp. CBW1107]|uniref:AAA family ATPase n=1 Tax=Synechococcus sp. CBW1107 TaxID=2789857 RepID=UPI002AD2EB9C|nr:AAA family ATPase [Synechococcus sp. CBW1107]CAK6695449.1 Chromosome partition protein Smc [Synechococcus sp. CBW1107]
MRLLTARLRDYRLHRDLAVTFDPRLTVISGPNQSGKSTLAEALHRALFLPVKTGGVLLESMRTDPFMADPDVELVFECADQAWTLRKRFASTRGSVSLQDSRGRSLQGDAAEEQLAELIGTAAVPRNRGAAEQLKERWGHLWVWQGSSSTNPLELSTDAYDHDRLVERLQTGAGLGVQSDLDLAVSEDIQKRWVEVYTSGGATRAPQVKRSSALNQAREAVIEAQDDLTGIQDLIEQQQSEQRAYEDAAESLARIASELPQRQQEREALQKRLARSRELQGLITQEEPVLAGLIAELRQPLEDREQLQSQLKRVCALDSRLGPQTLELEELKRKQPELESTREQVRRQLETLQQTCVACQQAAQRIEQRLNRVRLLHQQDDLSAQLAASEQLQGRLDLLEKDLALLPALDAKAVDQLRDTEQRVRMAQTRAESVAAGIEVLRAGQPVLLDGQPLDTGRRQMLSEAAVLQVGDDVEVRVLPGGGSSNEEAQQELEAARNALASDLESWTVATVEEAATAERRRSDLLAERGRLLEQRGSEDQAAIRQRLDSLQQRLESLPGEPQDDEAVAQDAEAHLARLTQELEAARDERDQAIEAEQKQQRGRQEAEADLDSLKGSIETLDRALQDGRGQLLEARTRIDEVLKRCGSPEVLEARINELNERKEQSETRLTGYTAELRGLDPASLKEQDQQLLQAIEGLQQQERQASDARIRAESRLHGDGRVDLQAELEQKQAELESRVVEQERLEKEAGMLSLLRRLLEEEQNAMASQYTAPITDRIGTYLGHVFSEAPRADLDYDARGGFQQLEWRRGNEAAFAFEVLSTGAREQFAAALRLAMAEVLAEAYDGCLPIVFDDAFAYSDPERQVGVYRMLEQAAQQGLQVILLSCDPERTEAIKGAGLVRLCP